MLLVEVELGSVIVNLGPGLRIGRHLVKSFWRINSLILVVKVRKFIFEGAVGLQGLLRVVLASAGVGEGPL